MRRLVEGQPRGAEADAGEQKQDEPGEGHPEGRAADVAEEPPAAVRVDREDDPVVLVRRRPQEPPVRAAMAVERHGSGVRRAADERHESVVGRAPQRRSQTLREATIYDDAPRRRVDDCDVEFSGQGGGLAAEGLEGDLEVDDRGGREAAPRHGRRVRDDPLVRVGRDVRLRLEHLAGVELERRTEEGVAALVRREVREGCADAADVARVFGAAVVDEARLADARRVELLEVAQSRLGVADRATAGLYLGEPRAGLAVELGEGRVVRRDEHDRPCPLEVGLEPARVLVGSVRKRVVEREAGLAALAHTEGGAACKEQDTHDERE